MLIPKRSKSTLFSLEQSIQKKDLTPGESSSLSHPSPSQPSQHQSPTPESRHLLWLDKRPRNTLFSLEQAIQPHKTPLPATPLPTKQHSSSHHVEAFAFDNGMTIELQYRVDSFSDATSFDSRDSFASALENEEEDYRVETFEFADLDDDPDDEFNQVEAFEASEFEDRNVEAIAPTNPAKAEDQTAIPVNPTATPSISEAQPVTPVKATVTPSTSEEQPAIPVNVSVVPTPSDFNDTSVQSVPPSPTPNEQSAITEDEEDALAFAADIEAILRGEKVYEPQSSQAFSQPPSQPAPPPKPPSQPEPHPHDIFEQMGQSLSHATAFDLGTLSLEETFDEFDKLLDEEERKSP